MLGLFRNPAAGASGAKGALGPGLGRRVLSPGLPVTLKKQRSWSWGRGKKGEARGCGEGL